MTAPAGTAPRLAVLKAASLCEGASSCLFLQFLVLHNRFALGESSLLVLSFILALPALVVFLMTNVWGAFVDATGRFRTAERAGLFGYAACLAALAAVHSSSGTILSVTGFALLYAALRPTLLSHATVLSEHARAGAISAILLWQSLGWFASGVIYGALYGPGREWALPVILGLPALCSLILGIRLRRWIAEPALRGAGREDPRGGAAAPAAGRAGLGRLLLANLGSVYRTPALLRVCVVVFCASTANWCFFGMFPVIYTEEWGGAEWMQGWTISLSTVVAVLIFPAIGRFVDRAGGRAGLLLCLGGYVTIYSIFTLTRDPWLASALFLVPMYPVFLVSANALAAEATGVRRRAGGLGAMAGVMAVSMAAGSVLGGAVGDALGLRAVVRAAAGVSLLALAVFLLFEARGRGARRGAP